jgi:hypothetical protein
MRHNKKAEGLSSRNLAIARFLVGWPANRKLTETPCRTAVAKSPYRQRPRAPDLGVWIASRRAERYAAISPASAGAQLRCALRRDCLSYDDGVLGWRW